MAWNEQFGQVQSMSKIMTRKDEYWGKIKSFEELKMKLNFKAH
jgi:hypothetical protein